MMAGVTLPWMGPYRLRNARVPAALCAGIDLGYISNSGLVDIDLGVIDGRFAPVHAAPGPDIELGGRLVMPTFVDMHTHLDKAYILERTGLPKGGLREAVGLSVADAPNRTEADLGRRMERALQRALLHGTSAMRTHLDTPEMPAESLAWRVFAAKRSAWEGRIALQAVALMSIERADDDSFPRRCAQIAPAGGILGAFIAPGAATPPRLDRFLAGAAEQGLDVDFHVDETLDPGAKGLEVIAEAVLRTGFPGRVVCGHGCSLSAMPANAAAHVVALVQRAGLHIVSLPLTNMFLMDRFVGTTPRRRGVTLVQEMQAAGISVSFASDNVRDPFFAFGDFDMLEVGREAIRTAHLDQDMAGWIDALFGRPAAAMGLADAGRIGLGRAADMIIFEARDWFDLFSQPQSDRTVLRAGTPIGEGKAPRLDVTKALETT